MLTQTEPVLLYNIIVRQLVCRPAGHAMIVQTAPKEAEDIEAARTLATYPLTLPASAFSVFGDENTADCFSALAWLCRCEPSDQYVIGAIVTSSEGMEPRANLVIVGKEERSHQVLAFLGSFLDPALDTIPREDVNNIIATSALRHGERRMCACPMKAALKSKLEQYVSQESAHGVHDAIKALLKWENPSTPPSYDELVKFFMDHDNLSHVASKLSNAEGMLMSLMIVRFRLNLRLQKKSCVIGPR